MTSAPLEITTRVDPIGRLAFEQESIAYRIAKCESRCGNLDDAIAGIEKLLYTRNFWSDKYRFGVFLPRFPPVPNKKLLCCQILIGILKEPAGQPHSVHPRSSQTTHKQARVCATIMLVAAKVDITPRLTELFS